MARQLTTFSYLCVLQAECYDPQTSRWVPIKPMLNRRCRLGSAALGGKIFACGGYDGSQFLRSVECYDPITDEWHEVGPMNVKVHINAFKSSYLYLVANFNNFDCNFLFQRSRVALVANCGKLFAIGGYDGISNLSSMEIYSVEEDKWQFGSAMVAHEGGVGIGVIPLLPNVENEI